MSVLTICNCYLRVKDQTGSAYSAAELTFQPRRSQVKSGDSLYISKTLHNTASPGEVIQDLLYIAVNPLSLTPVTVTYTAGGTAGAEVVTVTVTDISIQIESGVSTALQVQTAIKASAAASALVYCILSGVGTNAQVAASVTSFMDDYMYLPLSETTTDSQPSVFTLNWNDGNNYDSIIFDPVEIPNQSVLDLSTLLTVSRG